MHTPSLLRGAAVAALLSCSTAMAQAAASGFELERLELNPGRGLLLSGNGEPRSPGELSLMLASHYEHLPLVLRNGQEQRLERVRHRASAVLAGSYGVLPWLEVGAQVPAVLWQSGEDHRGLGLPAVKAYGGGSPLLQARLGLLSRRQEQPVDLSVDLGAGLPLGSRSALARDPGMRFRARVTVGRRWGWLEPALDAGVLVRPANLLIDKTSSGFVPELRVGAGVAVTHERLRGELALQSAFARSSSPTNKSWRSSHEVLGGVRLKLSSELELFALGGPGVGTAPGTPTVRVLVGLGFHKEPPPALQRLSEAIPQFRLEQDSLGPPAPARAEAFSMEVTPVPTRELVPADEPSASPTPLLEGSVPFEPGRAELSGDLGLLRAVVLLLRSIPGESVVVLEGQAGPEAGESADRLLPLKRAQAVRNYLAAQGVPQTSLRVRTSEARGGTPRVQVLVTP
jgi:OmpA-OmpF porin, OOP family